jgi:cell pole-organizing protein PopZ
MNETSVTRKSDIQEPPMEDILASIRRILAEDTETSPRDAEHRTTSDDRVVAHAAVGSGAEADEPRSLVSEGANPLGPDAPATKRAADCDTGDDLEDVLMLSADMRAADPALVSQRAAENSTDVLSQLARAILDRRDIAVASREVTLESMVREMLRPLLREWLDRNLPYLIERLVKKEIDVMINRAERLEH